MFTGELNKILSQDYLSGYHKEREKRLAEGLSQERLREMPQQLQAKLAYQNMMSQYLAQKARSTRMLDPLRAMLFGAQTRAAETRSMFTPQQDIKKSLMVQQLKNQAQLAAAQMRNKATDPFSKNQASLLSKQLAGVSGNAQEAMDKVIPTYTALMKAMNDTKLVGPFGTISWTTPAGQKFRAMLTKAQLQVFSKLKNVRTQREFNKIMSSVGSPTMYASAMKDLFQHEINNARRNVDKLHFYHQYVLKGGRDPLQAELNWEKEINPNVVRKVQESYDPKDLDYTGGKYNYSHDELKKMRGF